MPSRPHLRPLPRRPSWSPTPRSPLPGRAPLLARIYGRRKAHAATPLVLHFHGGTFTSGDLDSGACMARLLAEVDAVVVSLAYPLAPAHPFPDAVEAGYAALEWTYKQRNKLAGAGARVYLAGDEAGGNLAAAVALVARDRAHPPLAGQILVAPMLDPCVGTASLARVHGLRFSELQVGRRLAAVPAQPHGCRAPVCGAGPRAAPGRSAAGAGADRR